MSWFTDLRDSVQSAVVGVAAAGGLNLQPYASVGAGGTPGATLLPTSTQTQQSAPATLNAFAASAKANPWPWVAGAGFAVLVLFLIVRSK